MAAEIKEEFQTDVTLYPEGKGIFDVTKDGELIYSKYETGRFPKPTEVNGLIQRLISTE